MQRYPYSGAKVLDPGISGISGISGTTTLDSNQTSVKAVCPACRVPTLHVCAAVESVKNKQNVLTGTVCSDPLLREEMYKVNHNE